MAENERVDSLGTLLEKPGIIVSQRRGTKLHGHFDFVDETGRNEIYEWSQKRQKSQTRFWNRTMIYLITFKMIKTFMNGVSLVVFCNLLLTGLVTFLCQRFDISFDLQATLLLTPIIFPLSFLINNDYQRREKALLYLAQLKKHVYNLFLRSREFGKLLHTPDALKNNVYNKLNQIVFHVTEYVQTIDTDKKSVIVKIVYEDLSDLSQLIADFIQPKKNYTYAPLFVTRLLCIHEGITESFENLRIIRDYRSPFSTRAFAKIMSFALPILLCPFFIEISRRAPRTEEWSPYVISLVFSFTMGTMQSVQDRLYDPFVTYNSDAIDVTEIAQWASESIVHTAHRAYHVGRFRVNSTLDTKVVLDDTTYKKTYPRKIFNKRLKDTTTDQHTIQIPKLPITKLSNDL